MDKTKIHKMWIADQGDGTYTNPICIPIIRTRMPFVWERIIL